MMAVVKTTLILISAFLVLSIAAAAQQSQAVRLYYQEYEPAVAPYRVTYTVTDDHMRIDDDSDRDSYIVFDRKANKIFSVSHVDESTLVIPDYQAEDFEPDFKIDIVYEPMKDAPKVAGKGIYSYRVDAVSGPTAETCMDIQLVPGLLPEVAASLQAFQQLVAGQQSVNVDKTPDEFRTPCYLIDQIYNSGEYYSKGLPVQEWHSNGRMRQLLNYEETGVDTAIFAIPADYRQFSLQ